MDITEFKRTILPLNGKLYHYAFLLLKDKNESEDAVQEVNLKLWKIRDSLDNYDNIRAFAFKVTKNLCLDKIKAKKPYYTGDYNLWMDKKVDEADPQKSLEDKNQLKVLFDFIEKLPDQQKHIIKLRELEGLEFDEIAEIMDMKINSVRVNLARARNKIKTEMFKLESNGYQPNSHITGKIL